MATESAHSDNAHSDNAQKAHPAVHVSHHSPFHFDANPLAHVATNDPTLRLTAFGGEFQPGLYRPPSRKFGNPAPLGLSCFGLTTFVLSLINLQTRGVTEPNIVIAVAYAYGGLVQLLSGMWEFAVGNTFGATALSSFGGFWIAFAIILTPGGFEIVSSLEASKGGVSSFYDSMAFFLLGWFIFTTLLLLCTLKSTLAFFFLFFTLDIAFMMLSIGYLKHDPVTGPNQKFIKAGGGFGLAAAFLAWYNAFAGLADDSNSFFVVPVYHFPWSEKAKERKEKDAMTNGNTAENDKNV
ncbi:hypothetical protein K432DRAFT_380839 [Lepidopterella palustris CBS 459.81]|uniref:GPR/FUN34 family protein n=1 Tax=Lepidopterella palustris CBS 459.81 TaxID=1314670 RepID=A0A8E2EDW1_9PEZI|nr:hypothetical protein K432DRAFT_380839 [Lepidopterella palustris CBS 459.81]